jgi:hypothetical protein
MRFWAFSYSAGEPCERSFQTIMHFMASLPMKATVTCDEDERRY